MITEKTTGTLLDELYTAELKQEHWPDDTSVRGRVHTLGNAITVRLFTFYTTRTVEDQARLWSIAKLLKNVLRDCWNAQEVVMHYTLYTSYDLETKVDKDKLLELAMAAITAQKTNAQRNTYIREIDTLLGEDTVLAKTYA